MLDNAPEGSFWFVLGITPSRHYLKITNILIVYKSVQILLQGCKLGVRVMLSIPSPQASASKHNTRISSRASRRCRSRTTCGTSAPTPSATHTCASRPLSAQVRYQEERRRTITHEPPMLPSCEKALINASATARFEGGRAIELLTHVKKIMKPAYDCAIKNLGGHT